MSDTLLALILFLFPLAYSPGPGNMVFAANGARFGLRATVPASLGYHLATWLVTAAIGLGAVTTLDQAPQLFVVLKAAGALYVFWLAWKLLRANTFSGSVTATPAGFVDGAVLLLLNPKAYVIIALMFSQFLSPSKADPLGIVVLITTVFTVNNLVAFTLWTVFGDWIAGRIRRADNGRILNTLFGGILAGVGIWMLLA